MKDTLEAPRWKGGPCICLKANLPAFRTQEKAIEFHDKVGPGNRITKIWQCDFCDMWHYRIRMRPPSGDSSGTGRR